MILNPNTTPIRTMHGRVADTIFLPGRTMQFEEFENNVKIGLSNLYDFAALEKISSMIFSFQMPEQSTDNRGDFVRNLFLEHIEKLKPEKAGIDQAAPDWRSYSILYNRYVEGKSAQEVASQLSISERQLRRYTRKAINALALLLWEKTNQVSSEKPGDEIQQDFIIDREEVDIREILNGVISLLSNRISEKQIRITTRQSDTAIIVKSDRIILRQILIGLLNDLLQNHVKDIEFSCNSTHDYSYIKIASHSYSLKKALLQEQDPGQEKNIRYWEKQLHISITEDFHPDENLTTITLTFLSNQQKTILVVDDQEPALRMFTRYLSRTNFKIIGLRKPAKVLERALALQPVLIILDIMMPKVDGWEIFQTLKVNEKTKHIPVIICSAWGEPELAKSLGATAFLRKPVTQRDLLTTIELLQIEP